MTLYGKPNRYDQCLYMKKTNVFGPAHHYMKGNHEELEQSYQPQKATPKPSNPMEKPMDKGK